MPVCNMHSAKLLNLNGSFKTNFEVVKNGGFFLFFLYMAKGSAHKIYHYVLFSQNFEVASILDLR